MTKRKTIRQAEPPPIEETPEAPTPERAELASVIDVDDDNDLIVEDCTYIRLPPDALKALPALLRTAGFTEAAEKVEEQFRNNDCRGREAYIEAARDIYFNEGDDYRTEVDDDTIVSGSEEGAYVMAWCWVPKTDAGLDETDEDEDTEAIRTSPTWASRRRVSSEDAPAEAGPHSTNGRRGASPLLVDADSSRGSSAGTRSRCRPRQVDSYPVQLHDAAVEATVAFIDALREGPLDDQEDYRLDYETEIESLGLTALDVFYGLRDQGAATTSERRTS
jgi:hypothetical protein